ncbi:MAG: hypothetical protein OHK0039_00370 [Bacteroidia bacterium]
MNSPAHIAWRRFRRHVPAMAGLCYLCLCLLLATGAYLLGTDDTRHANFQVLELAKRPPGTRAWLLLVPLTGQAGGGNWLTGYVQTVQPVALADTASLALHGGYLRYVPLGGPPDSIAVACLGEHAPPASLQELIDRHVVLRHYRLGTDSYGRDLLSRLLLGGRVSLSIGISAVLISLVIGLLLGTLAGYLGGWVDGAIMWLVSVVWSVPTLLLALAVSFVLGKGFWQLMLAIGVSMWVEVARVVRGQILSVREQSFVEAARALGYRSGRIMFRHILPNVFSPLIVIAVSNFGAAVLVESGLSFLGIGVEVPVPTWGRMIYEGYTYIVFEHGKWLAFFPGLALVLLIVSINLIGIGLRDALDVKL